MPEMSEGTHKPMDFKAFCSVVKEFTKALGRGHTFNIRKNSYLIFGILWGIPVPIVTIGMGLFYKNLVPSLSNILSEISANQIHFFFLMHPVLFGIVFGAMGTVRDDNERERENYEKSVIEINKKLKDTNNRLQELDELKDNFLSMVSHELWSPLTTVEGYITFMKDEKAGRLTKKQKEILEIAEEQVDHLSHLIGELVDLSTIESGKFEVNLSSIDMAEVASRVINSLKQTADEKDIVLRNRLVFKTPCVTADKKRMTQVFTNLLGNAIKFTPEHGMISVSAREKDDTVEFYIADNGIGIPEESIERIFDKFYQADSTNRRRYSGCGLGLAITKNILELHGSEIFVESEVGQGSKFSFELKKCKSEKEAVKCS